MPLAAKEAGCGSFKFLNITKQSQICAFYDGIARYYNIVKLIRLNNSIL